MLEVGGFTPLSTSDWPDRLAAVVFVQGCPWRCGYCHNADLQVRGRHAGPSWSDVMATLAKRVGLLDGVIFSGGEPTLEARLSRAVDQIRELGMQVGMHTGGGYPKRLRVLLPSLAWVGFDLKTDYAAYDVLTGRRRSSVQARNALDFLMASGVDHEIRTTYHPAMVADDALLSMARVLRTMGARQWVLQRWRAHDEASQDLQATWHWPHETLLQALREEVPGLSLR